MEDEPLISLSEPVNVGQQPSPLTVEELQDRIVNYWQRMDGWIPGAAWLDFAHLIGVDPERMKTARRRLRELHNKG